MQNRGADLWNKACGVEGPRKAVPSVSNELVGAASGGANDEGQSESALCPIGCSHSLGGILLVHLLQKNG